jgi:predicted adenylyl cyclase CyaB
MGEGAREVEIKLRVDAATLEGLRHRLAHVSPTVHRQRDLHFRIPERVLRLREQDGNWFLTRKGPTELLADGTRSREEIEQAVPVAVVPLLIETFEWLGIPRSVEVRKVREEYRLDGVTCCIDRIDGLEGVFVELEVLGQTATESRLSAVREELGLGACPVETRGYARLVAESEGGPD